MQEGVWRQTPPWRDNFHYLYPEHRASVGNKHREVIVLKHEVLYVL